MTKNKEHLLEYDGNILKYLSVASRRGVNDIVFFLFRLSTIFA
jgi:hypothetical protein